MTSKRQQTMAKMARERTVRERRERKLEKKQAAAAERRAAANGIPREGEDALGGDAPAEVPAREE
jgi:hypothetical protein